MTAADKLSVDGLKRYLNAELLSCLEIEVFDSVSSTNILAKKAASSGCPEGRLIVSDSQTAGRGRSGRVFYSPDSTGIYMSLVLRPGTAGEDSSVITAAAAVAVSEAIEKVSGKKAGIKWVNDILIDGKKVCGILTEAAFSGGKSVPEYAVVGIGVNVYPPQGGFPPDISGIAASVFQTRKTDMKNRLAAEILNSFIPVYKSEGTAGFIDRYRSRCNIEGERIIVISSDRKVPATALGIDERCRLLVRYDDGSTAALSSGEVSIRRHE